MCMKCYVMVRHVILYSVMLGYVILCSVMLFYVSAAGGLNAQPQQQAVGERTQLLTDC